MYVTQRPNDVMALDAKTGRLFWIYHWAPDPGAQVCCGSNNRGVAILGNTLFMGTLDAHLIAIDAKTGKALWNTVVADLKSRLFDHHGALDREGPSSGRRGRRRIRCPRLCGGFRSPIGEGIVALQCNSRSG